MENEKNQDIDERLQQIFGFGGGSSGGGSNGDDSNGDDSSGQIASWGCLQAGGRPLGEPSCPTHMLS
jgi:hypothetical protein